MFSLIITIVSIALVVALVAATMYHGGDTLTQGRTSADAAAFVAGAQQIAGAQVMNMSLKGVEQATVAGLITDKALASSPVVKGGAWAIDPATNLVSNTVTSADVCLKISETAGVAAATITSGIVVAADFAQLSYGCDTATKTFSFKY